MRMKSWIDVNISDWHACSPTEAWDTVKRHVNDTAAGMNQAQAAAEKWGGLRLRETKEKVEQERRSAGGAGR